MKTFKHIFLLLVLLSSALFQACKKYPDREMKPIAEPQFYDSEDKIIYPSSCSDKTTVELLTSSGSIDVGTVEFSNDAKSLFIYYRTNGEWLMHDIHLYIGDKRLIPLTKDLEANITSFPFIKSFREPAREYVFTVPLKQLSPLVNGYAVSTCATVSKIARSTQSLEPVERELVVWGKGTKFTKSETSGSYFNIWTYVCHEPVANPK